MSKRQVLMLIGVIMIVVFILPGLPDFLKRALAVILGFLVIFIATRLKPEVRNKKGGDVGLPYGESRRESGQQVSLPVTSFDDIKLQ